MLSVADTTMYKFHAVILVILHHANIHCNIISVGFYEIKFRGNKHDNLTLQGPGTLEST